MQISIIIPLHNKGKYIAQTLASIQEQTYENWEAIVVENYSTDNGPDVVRKIAAKEARILLIEAPKEVRGPGAARNIGLDFAQGGWVLFLDADDLLEREYLENMLNVADNNPDASIIAAPWKQFIQKDGQNERGCQLKEPAGYQQNGNGLEGSAIGFTCWAVHAAIIRRNWLHGERIWPVELDKYLAEDTAFWFRVVWAAKVAYCSFPGALYRAQTIGCRTNYNPDAWFEGCHQAIKSNLAFIASGGIEPSLQQKITLIRAYSNLYIQSKTERNKKVADKSLKHAKHWLMSACNEGKEIDFHMRLRKLFGIAMYENLKFLLQKLNKWQRN